MKENGKLITGVVMLALLILTFATYVNNVRKPEASFADGSVVILDLPTISPLLNEQQDRLLYLSLQSKE